MSTVANHTKQKVLGFTLLEVLIALAVLAISSMAIVRQTTQTITYLQQLESKTLATYIADNHIAQLRIAESWPDIGGSSQLISTNEKQWQINTTVTGTTDPWLRKIEVSVTSRVEQGDDVLLSTLTAYQGRY